MTSNEFNLHKIAPPDTAFSFPVVESTAAPRNSIFQQGLAATETAIDAFKYLSSEYKALAEKMFRTTAGERNETFQDMFNRKDSVVLESNPEIPGDPRGKIDRLAIALLDDSIGKALKLPPVNLVMGNSDKVNRQISDAGSSKINFTA